MTSDPQASAPNPEEDSEKAASDVTLILQALQSGESQETEDLIPVVYDELRRLAAYRLSHEKPGQTLQATALVHEAYLRLLKSKSQSWESRRHFFGAAAEAMRRILIDNARSKAYVKRGGHLERTDFEHADAIVLDPSVDILDLHSALEELEQDDPSAAEVVKLRYFAGLTWDQIAKALGVSPRTCRYTWDYGKAWLFERLKRDPS